MIYIRQIPGKPYTFIKKKTGEKDSGILPKSCGESNSFARWSSKSALPTRGGCWTSRRFTSEAFMNYYKGRGPAGLIARMRHLVAASKKTAIRDGHEHIKTSPEDMLAGWESQNNLCMLCDFRVEILDAFYDHNHETGEGRGFVHPVCNSVDGFLTKVPKENRIIILNKLKLRYCAQERA